MHWLLSEISLSLANSPVQLDGGPVGTAKATGFDEKISHGRVCLEKPKPDKTSGAATVCGILFLSLKAPNI